MKVSRLSWGVLFWPFLFLLLAGCRLEQGLISSQDSELVSNDSRHSVAEEFLRLYQAASDPLLLYGNPITDAFQDPTSGRLVQYFEGALFELFPNRGATISDIGRNLYTPGQTVPIHLIPSACRTDAQVGIPICYAFLDFYEAYGGKAQFGLPISGFEIRSGRLVQYFEKARFEWWPENPSGQRVQIGDLGSQLLILYPELARLASLNTLGSEPVRIQARAYPQKPVSGLNGQQTIYVLVEDQSRQPLAGAKVTLSLPKTFGGIASGPLNGYTDERGIAEFSFNYRSSKPGLVTLQSTIRYKDLESETSTSFWMWW